jgi:metal-sulfur cluster biosynthetic enzyme
MAQLINANPVIYNVSKADFASDYTYADEEEREGFSANEIFNLIKDLNDPEHPLTLEQLNVVNAQHIEVHDESNKVLIQFTPTIPHCSMATLIGLSIRVKLLRSLPTRFKVTVKIYPGTHQTEDAINKQLNDKERVAAALENAHLLNIVNKCIARK